MNSQRLVILVAASDFSTDPRVYKQGVSARDDGWSVTVCCYSNFDKYSDTIEDGCRIVRIPYLNIIRMIPGVPAFIIHMSNKFFGGCTKKIISVYSQNKFDSYNQSKKCGILYHITEFCRVYLWALVLYVFAQIHFYFCVMKFKADVYHSTDLITLLTGALLKYTNGGKLLYDSHEMWVESMEDYPQRLKKLVSFYEKYLIRRADAITTVNSQIAKELSEKYNIMLPTVVMNTPLLQDAPIQKSHTDIRVVYQGRYTRNRGIETVIRTVPNIPGVTLYMRGIDAYAIGNTTPFVDELQKIDSRVIFLPPVPMKDLVQSLNEFDIGVVPYIGNNFNNTNASPNKTFEYMMAGLAVVTSDLPVLREIVERSKCGCTYIQDDGNELSRVIIEMIPRLEIYKHNARMWSEKEYNWNVQGKKLIDIYGELIK